MSIKRYGIFLGYAPTVDLRGQGLGRYLANFLKGAESRKDVRFVLACPGWLKPQLEKLFIDENVSPNGYEIIATRGMPLSLHFYFLIKKLHKYYLKRKSKVETSNKTRATCMVSRNIIEKFLCTRNLLFFLILLPLMISGLTIFAAFLAKKKIFEATKNYFRDIPGFKKIKLLLIKLQSYDYLFSLYRYIESKELGLLVNLINNRNDIKAWYSPSAFFPEFNGIKGAKLVCVPDVVLMDFPVGFSIIGNDRFLHTFDRVRATIYNAEQYVTYSNRVKWDTVVDRFGVNSNRVHVIEHGSSDLSGYLYPQKFENQDQVDEHSRILFLKALKKSLYPEYTNGLRSTRLAYLFYASQFRPNKNILTLLRAYEWLLRHDYLGVKLVLTGNPHAIPEIWRYVSERDLRRDVLFLHNLNVSQLAACYRLARLAVNPSLFEGGFPFTFDEALSVGTPVVMARIGVTEEAITDPELQKLMLFDPYDWRDMADKIVYALENRDLLYQKQKIIYDARSKRNWNQVVDDYINLLDTISQNTPT